MNTERFLDAALRIGRRLVSQAEWDGDACTWVVMSPDRENPGSRVSIPTRAGGMLYEGTSGIGLFLTELAAATGNDEIARAALGAVEFALRDAAQLPESSFGYHSGRVGIAYAAVRAGECLDRPDLFARAEEILRPLAGKENSDFGMDVIGGAGGAIPALLRLARRIDPELCLGMARRLGDNLIESATRDTDGFSWATMRSSSIRNLCGYAHGAAGMGHALLELYAATGEGAYRYAAEQTFVYERRFFNPEESNWPDLRHAALGEYQFEGRMEELRTLLREGGDLPSQGMRYMAAWCHGGPGIGFSRLRAWELLGGDAYLEESRASFESVRRSVTGEFAMNYSLCHGRTGNCETLVEGARILGDPSLLEPAYANAVQGIEEHEDGDIPWPCGTMGSVSDPGLLLGEAGIGMFLLRLAHPEVPSPIFLTVPEVIADVGKAGEEGYSALRRRVVEEHFIPTLRSFAALGVDVDEVIPKRPMGAPPERSDVREAYEAIAAYVAAEPDAERRALLEDAFAVDRARHDLALGVEDYTREVLDALGRRGTEELDWSGGRAGLSPRVRILSTRYDWTAWLQREDAPAPPEESDVHWLLHFTSGSVALRRLSPFAALVLQTVEEPATVEEILAAVEEALGGNAAPDRGWLEDRVVEQLAQAYRAGFVTFAPGLVPVPA